MLNFILILLGLISNPNSDTSNCGNDGTTPGIVQPNPTPPTGGDEGHPVPPRIIGG